MNTTRIMNNKRWSQDHSLGRVYVCLFVCFGLTYIHQITGEFIDFPVYT